MRVPQRLRHALILLGLAAGCGSEVPPAPALPAGIALSLDGVVITEAEIRDYLPYFASLDPTMGRNKCIRILLDQHLVPIAFMRREFGPAREEQRRRAESLARHLGPSAGYSTLVAQGRNYDGAENHEGIVRQHLPIPEHRWLFEAENLGRVSPVLEAPQGFSLVAASDLHPGRTKAYDQADVQVVRFYTHNPSAYKAWQRQLYSRLGTLAKESKLVHPDYRDALPPWLRSVTFAPPAPQ